MFRSNEMRLCVLSVKAADNQHIVISNVIINTVTTLYNGMTIEVLRQRPKAPIKRLTTALRLFKNITHVFH